MPQIRREDLMLSASAANPGLDRAAHLRSEPDSLAQRPHRLLRVHNGQLKVNGNALDIAHEPVDLDQSIFLGLDGDGIAYFVQAFDAKNSEAISLRNLASELSIEHRLLAAHAVALMNWHESHPHCPRCGQSTRMSSLGNARYCASDDKEFYPRTDAAVIVLVKDKQDRILLGRQSSWPKGRFSTFAGFVEAGESFESAVEREVFEECGVRSQEIHYLGSQPWPFPASIMVAFEIEAENPDVARADGIEIEQVAWFTRKELLDAISSGEILLPPGISIARRMIENWYGARLLGGEAWR